MKFNSSTEVLHFEGTDGKDVYNITAPFAFDLPHAPALKQLPHSGGPYHRRRG